MELDLSRYTGIGQFGPAYRIMLENDCHAPGSVDRVLMERMVRLCQETVPHLYRDHTPTGVRYEPGSRPALERYAGEAPAGSASGEDSVAAIAEFCAGIGQRAPGSLDEMRVGGTEEEIIARGTDWCTDVARVACVLYQVAGLPSRMVSLADTAKAYSGHVIVEVYRRGTWGAVDSSTGVVYRHPDGAPATTWELMSHPELVDAHGPAAYTTPGQFRAAAISNYFVEDNADYDYSVSPVNGYYRSILAMSDRGWPGGLRWLHGEDRGPA